MFPSYFPGFMAVSINTNNDKHKEGTAETKIERNEHESGTTATLKSWVIGRVNYVGMKRINIFASIVTENDESNFRYMTQWFIYN